MMELFSNYDRLISFVSVHHAIRAEKLLHEAGILVAALPTPREINISCGQCLLCKAEDVAAAMEIFQQEQVCWSQLFHRDSLHRKYQHLADY